MRDSRLDDSKCVGKIHQRHQYVQRMHELFSVQGTTPRENLCSAMQEGTREGPASWVKMQDEQEICDPASCPQEILPVDMIAQ